MIKKIRYILKFILLRLNKRIVTNGLVIINKHVKIIVEKNAKLILGEFVVLKEKTTIYIKSGATLYIGSSSSTGHNTEITCGNKIKIGDNVILGAYTYITDSDHNYRDTNILIKNQGMNIGTTIIGDNIWIGRGAYILRNAVIGNRSVIGAGAIVTKSFAGDSIIAGIPAKKIRSI